MSFVCYYTNFQQLVSTMRHSIKPRNDTILLSLESQLLFILGNDKTKLLSRKYM